MQQYVHLFRKSVLSISLLTVGTASFAGASLEEQIEQLQQQVQQLQTLIQQQSLAQQKTQQQIEAQLPKLEEKANSKPSAKSDLTHFVTKNGAEFELYGNVRADASYQIRGPSTMYNYISSVPLQNTAAENNNSDKFQSTMNATRFGLNFKTPVGEHSLGGKLEMDFFGGSGRDTFRIRHAYMTYDNWLLGQTWSNFNAVEYFPETVDASLSVGGSLTRTPQIKYTYPIDKNMNLAVSLEDPKAETVTTSGTQDFKTDANAKLKMPSAVGRLNYKFDNGSALSGRLFLTQKATTYGKHDDFLAWGAALGGKLKIADNSLIRFDYNHIKGDTKNVLWSNYAYVFNADENIKPNEFDTLAVGFTQQWTPKIRSTLGAGYMRANDDNDFSALVKNDTTQNKELKEAWINMFYNPVKPINVGVEYMYGERKTFSDLKGIDNRVNFTAIYDF
ncbi:DcaP family trimeric outer membrane transporter [Acinetobacter pragensis]|uniref:DcaP-like protein n=1 Tax=Acinetobacter pragensis TaxID=1806892 RepID=A0A151XYS3_9GAMM|nr:DcaP family trimeric outer membrane transporter [Acinetobacter pragensis]KYQ70983.1 DcaP-like protein [Acinetobacter pragensis]